METSTKDLKEEFIRQNLEAFLKANEENSVKFKNNAFLKYHSNNLTVSFSEHGLAHSDTAVHLNHCPISFQ